ncbi:hypothetical protein GCM10027293_21570 [Pontibacter aydingkolensis]
MLYRNIIAYSRIKLKIQECMLLMIRNFLLDNVDSLKAGKVMPDDTVSGGGNSICRSCKR